MKIHKGPLNLSSVSMKNPLELMKDLITVIEELSIKFKIVKFQKIKKFRNPIFSNFRVWLVSRLPSSLLSARRAPWSSWSRSISWKTSKTYTQSNSTKVMETRWNTLIYATASSRDSLCNPGQWHNIWDHELWVRLSSFYQVSCCRFSSSSFRIGIFFSRFIVFCLAFSQGRNELT